MSKQSSIEWLDVELTSLHFHYLTGQVSNSEFSERKKLIMEQAKAMHKEEIKEAWYNSLTKADYLSGDEYYKGTFEK